MAFPTTSVLDDFQRANEGPPPSASWSSADLSTTGGSKLRVISNAMKSNTDSLTGNQGGAYGTTYGPDTEVFVTLSTLPGDSFRAMLWLRLADIGGAGTQDGYQLRCRRQDGNPGYDLSFFRWDNNTATALGATTSDLSGAISNGVKIGFEAVGSTLSFYIDKTGTWSAAITTRSDGTYTASGLIGVAAQDATTTVFDDFGGGTVVTGPTPDPPSLYVNSSGLRW